MPRRVIRRPAVAAVELAFVLLFFLVPLVIGVWEVGRLIHVQQIVSNSAREGARGFPANVNVAAALSLAGVGPDRTRLEIWADPTVERNTHRIVVEADSASFQMTIENVPSEENPRTGKITALSIIAALRSLTATLKVGT